MRLAWSLLLLAFLATPPAAAQQHDHAAGSGVVISHDSNAAGYEFVGNLAHFGVLTLGDDLVPDFHEQNHIRVTMNGAVLMETTPDSGHDYDGVNLFDVTFPVAGTYTVASLDESGVMLAMFNGTVVDVPSKSHARAMLTFEAPSFMTPGVPATFSYGLHDGLHEDNVLLNHTDAWFEIWDTTGLVFRTKTHTHDEVQEISYTYLGPANRITARVSAFQAYPGPAIAPFLPLADSVSIEVFPIATPGPLPSAGPAVVPDAPLENRVVTGEGGERYTLLGTYDPWTTVGPSTQLHLAALVMDPSTRQPAQHVDFRATLKDRVTGIEIFSSSSLHEYDGIWELTAQEPVGEYVLEVTANRGNWTALMQMPFTVVPPVAAVLPGEMLPSVAQPVEFVEVTGLDQLRSGVPFTLGLAIHDAAGNPLQHSEVDYQILDESFQVPLLTGKLHTHETGTFELTAAIPQGNYSLRLSPFALEPRPTLLFYGPPCVDVYPASSVPCHIGSEIPFTVGPGSGFPAAADAATEGSDRGATSAPGPGQFLLLASLVLAALVLRKRA